MKQNAPDLAGKWKMRFLPVWNDDSYLTAPRGGAGMGITAASDNKEEAWEFIAEAAAAMAPVNVDPHWTLFVDAVNRLVVQQVTLDGVDPQTAINDAIDEFEFNK
ncbi:MAG: extracellular solute-binding protein [Chloroflexi bacterium]|nr:extracellular solute-binding protein [Chloroflexota bacterium]